MVNSLKKLLMLYHIFIPFFDTLSETFGESFYQFSNSLPQKVLEAESSSTVCLFCLYSSAEIALNIIKLLFLQKFEVFFVLYIRSLFIIIRV